MTSAPSVAQRTGSSTRAYRLAALLFGIGTIHFVAPKPVDAMVPPELPGSPRFYTYASGAAEFTIGGMLLGRRTRRLGALAAAGLFVSVFPANLHMVRMYWDKPWAMKVAALARLPLQVPLITEAIKVYRTS